MDQEPNEINFMEDLTRAFVASFNRALNSGRVRLGLGDSVELLGEVEPKSIVVCVVPYIPDTSDALKRLNVRLMEAFCREHSVRLIKVTSMEGFCTLLRLAQKLASLSEVCSNAHYQLPTMEILDLLIIEAAKTATPEDDVLKVLYDKKCGTATAPVLPAVFPTYFDV